jgi:TctA family transporter
MLDGSISNAIVLCALMLSFVMLTVVVQSVIRLGVKLLSLTQHHILVQVLKCISMLGSIISNAIMFRILMLVFGRLTVILQSVIRLGVKMPSLMQHQLLAEVLRS